MNKLILIDGNAILHRAYHALPKTFRTKKGEPINAVYGFVSMLLKIIADLKPTHIACAFDLKEPTFRKIEFEQYQAHRPEMDEDLDVQFDKAKEVVSSFGIPIYERAGFEADDVIGTLAVQAVGDTKILRYKDTKRKKKKSPNISISQYPNIDEVIIVTGDKDILQLVNDKIKVYMPVKGLSQAQLMGQSQVFEKMGVRPDQVDEYKSLVGDPSDNYKGVPGIGPKTAEKLLGEYKDLDEIYSNLDKIDEKIVEKLKAGEKSARQSQRLAQIVTDVDVDFDLGDAGDWSVGRSETLALLEDFGFKSLTKRVLKMSGKTMKEKLTIDDVKAAVLELVRLLGKVKFAIRGTASLVLQELDMGVDDIDVICDKKIALLCNKVLKKFQVEKVSFKESEKYKSYFGKFVIEGVMVEVMGEWQIKKTPKLKISPAKQDPAPRDKTPNWSKKYDASEDQITYVMIKNKKVPVTKIETELLMFSEMGRWNAYHKIKKQLEEKNQLKLL